MVLRIRATGDGSLVPADLSPRVPLKPRLSSAAAIAGHPTLAGAGGVSHRRRIHDPAGLRRGRELCGDEQDHHEHNASSASSHHPIRSELAVHSPRFQWLINGIVCVIMSYVGGQVCTGMPVIYSRFAGDRVLTSEWFLPFFLGEILASCSSGQDRSGNVLVATTS